MIRTYMEWGLLCKALNKLSSVNFSNLTNKSAGKITISKSIAHSWQLMLELKRKGYDGEVKERISDLQAHVKPSQFKLCL